MPPLASSNMEMRTALDLDPLSIPINWDIGGELMYAGRYDESLAFLQKASKLFPDVPIFQYMEEAVYHFKGDRESARRVVDSVRASPQQVDRDPMLLGIFGLAAATEGRAAEARRILGQMERLRKTQYVDGFIPLTAAASLQDKEQEAVWLQRLDEERSSMFVYLPLSNRTLRLDRAVAARFENAR